jgi:cell division protease FtsH
VNNFGKNLALWIVIGLLLVALFNLFQTSSSRGPQATLAFSDFLNDVNGGQVTDVTIQGNNISGHLNDGRAFTTYAPSDPNLVSRLTDKRVRITAAPVDENVPSLFGVLVPDASSHRCVDLLHAPDAGRRRAGDGVRQEPGAAADGKGGADHL